MTFNRKPSFDDVVFDVMRYDQRKIVVLDADEDIASRVIFVTESGQSAQDIMTNGFISWDMATAFDLIEDDLTIPSDAGFILVTNRSNDYSFEGGSTSDFDGEFVTGSSVTISGVEESQYGFKTTVYYIYDLANSCWRG